MPSPHIDSLFPLLLPELPECPLDSVRTVLRRACRRFCRESTAWRILLEPVLLAKEVGEYPLVLPADSEIVLLCNVYRPRGELTGTTLDQLKLLLPDWSSAIGNPLYFNSLVYTHLRIYPAPVEQYVGEELVPRAALTTTMAAADLPEELTTRYDEALAAGALEILYAMTGRPWARSPAQVAEQRDTFNRLAVAARIAVEHERVRGNLRVQPRRFGA